MRMEQGGFACCSHKAETPYRASAGDRRPALMMAGEKGKFYVPLHVLQNTERAGRDRRG